MTFIDIVASAVLALIVFGLIWLALEWLFKDG